MKTLRKAARKGAVLSQDTNGAENGKAVGVVRRQPRVQRERGMQVSLFKWAHLQRNIYPSLAMMFAVPNGGLRDIRVARKLTAEGVKPGVPDIFLPLARGQYHGLWLELKASPNKTTEHQNVWLGALMIAGYRVAVVTDDWTKARDILIEYITGIPKEAL